MHIVTLRHDPLGLWVDKYPVLIPPLDSILVETFEAFDLANEWGTDLQFLDKSREYDYLVFLPEDLRETVRWSGQRLGLC
jgi:hypothetical protein